MKKLLLFLALCSSTAGAMQSEATPTDVVGTTPVKQEQVDLVASVAEQASVLNPEQRQQAIAQAAENVQKVVDSCGNDKELLKTTLSWRIRNLLMHPIAGSFFAAAVACLEVALLIGVARGAYALAQGINFVTAIAFGKQMLTPHWISLSNLVPLLCFKIGLNIGWFAGYEKHTA